MRPVGPAGLEAFTGSGRPAAMKVHLVRLRGYSLVHPSKLVGVDAAQLGGRHDAEAHLVADDNPRGGAAVVQGQQSLGFRERRYPGPTPGLLLSTAGC